MYLYCVLFLLSGCWFAQCKISEYQLESEVGSQCEQLRAVGAAQQQDHVPQCSEDGRYRHVQCNRLGECWCVNGDGSEISGSRQTTSVVHCLTSCQLQRQRALLSQDTDLVPQCMESGEYQPVQCDGALGQCWCVDLEGMEIYGTRQNGRPSECPGACHVRERRLLHGVGEPSPPQCSDDGNFLPVQCKLINTTDMMVFDLLHTFNRFPELFQTFSGFRKAFPELSSYCYCADTRGRELPRTGLELLLSEVYDTAFSSQDVGRSFSDSNMYRILQRRYLTVHLALSGQFRCPTPCESEQSASSQAGNVFVPSCDARGNYLPTQCQAGGQCWCVDSDGKEIFGTRQHGVPNCRGGPKDCLSERRQALSRLFYGPAGYFSQNNVFLASSANMQKTFSPLMPCSLEFQEILAKSGLFGSLPESERLDIGDILAEIVQGLFPTGGLALKALSLTTNPKRLQENLFGGKILKNAASFNFTGTVGTRGTLRFGQVFSQVGLIQNGEDLLQLARFFSDDSIDLNLDQNISDSYGRSVNLQRNRDLIKLIGTVLENEQFFSTLQQTITLLKAEDNAQLGPIFQAVFQKDICESAATSLYVPQCTEDGQYLEIQCQGSECWCVDSNGLEIMGSRSTGSRPRCPSQCEKERRVAIGIKSSRSAGSEVFIPKCEKDGDYVPLQCLGKSCFCMDHTGARHNTLSSGGSLQCPTNCQVTAAQYFLNTVTSILASPASLSLSDIYIPRCTSDGSWHQIQCDGPPEQVFLFYTEWSQVNNAGKQLPVSEFLNILQEYRRNPEAMVSFKGFLFALFQARHQKVFPSLSRFDTFSELPSEILDGNAQTFFGQSVFLNPLSLWRLLRGDVSQYPGPLSDFSAPLGHFNLRQCWCVDQKGAMIPDSKTSVNQVPKCSGSCSLVRDQADKFLAEAERLIALSNSTHIPVGYSFLLAESVKLSPGELQQAVSPGFQISDVLLSNTDSALYLAAYSTLQFYWQSSLLASGRDSQSLLFGYQPYNPQCDTFGQWLPSQCHPSTGYCWCVDEDGGYITGSLTARSIQPPQCQTTCQRSQTQFRLSVWRKATSNMTVSYSSSCEEDGEFSVLQKYDPIKNVAVCVSPATGEVIQPATLSPTGELQCPSWCALWKKLASEREAGIGYEPECVEDAQTFTPQQCDDVHCWCVSKSGQEIPSTRSPRLVKTLSCDSPQCPLVFGISVYHGAILCANESVAGKQRQRCEVFCDQGYINALSAETFLCDQMTRTWLGEAPLTYSCQRAQPLQTVQVTTMLQLSLEENQQSCSVQRSLLQASLLYSMQAAGLCSLKLSSGQYISICDDSSVSLECMSQQSVTAYITFKARLSDLPVSVLPDLHDVDTVLSSQMKLKQVMALIRNKSYQSVFIQESTTASSLPAIFSCSSGFQLLPDSSGCVVCPAGSFSSGGRCVACPRGSYQSEAGKTFCLPCTSGTSTEALGAFSLSYCFSECQQSELNCTVKGDFLSAQKLMSGKWLCVTVEGEELSWTSADEPLTAEQCTVLEKFQAVPVSSLLLNSLDAVVLQSSPSPQPLETQIRECVLDCAKDASCQYVTVFRDGTQTVCDLYSTDATNVECKTSQETKGFLGNEAADTFQALSCLLKVKVGDEPNLTVLRKKGYEFNTAGVKSFKRLNFHKVNSGVYRTLIFEASRASLDDVHHFCADTCSQENCCDGFILNQNVLNGGSVMCGLLSFPGVLQCNAEDWDVTGVASSGRTCGAGLKYNKQQKRFTFEFGGQNFTITDSALPASSKNKSDYQATIISFQQVYLWTESDMNIRPKTEGSCGGSALLEVSIPTLSELVKENFKVLDFSEIKTDSTKETSSQRYWVFKHQFTSEEGQLWCLKRCMEEEFCHVADLRDEAPLYFTCLLYPDTRVCGAYDKPLRQACSLVLPQDPQTAYQKKVNLTGSVKSFYSRVPFRKMVSYSVRYRVPMLDKSITEGFFECERRCDEDPCCRGIGYIQDTGASDVQCLTLNSLGIQTCGENERTKWRVQDCSPSKVQTEVYPFGWYEKPVNQWTESPGICPSFKLRSPSKVVDLKTWRQLGASYILVDSSVSAYDAVHISRDIADDLDKVRDWCLAACEENNFCSAVSVASRESAVRCVMYPDTHICLPTSSGQHCVLLIKEPAQYVYLRTDLRQQLTSVTIPGHGTLLGKNEMNLMGSDSKSVTYFLGVPYASPPTGEMRFMPPKPADWTGTWNATFAWPTCPQPGDTGDSGSSEDCLYLNIFVPSSVKQPASVLVFFHNPGSGFLDGSYLAAVGNIIVVTANFRVAAFGFLSTGSSDLSENYGLQDQEAALGWVQENIALFGGDPTRVTLGADRNGADIASLHLSSSMSSSLFHQALLMGGSVFSPATVMSKQKAQEQAVSLGLELGCSSLDPAQLLFCLRQKSAESINAAQTKLLAVSGPLQAWSPVVDGVVIKEQPSAALSAGRFHRVPLMLGSSAEDGLISRAKNIKNFEQLQGRADSKTAFYEALSNSLGGDAANWFVKEAATWFYSLQHSPTPSGYSVFSRALENATRDLFITCPSIKMASFWASSSRSAVYMYHLPQDMVHTSVDFTSPLDVQYVFGLPHVPDMRQLFTSSERILSSQIMSYMANFVKSGNPNLPLSVSGVSFSELLPPWPQFLPHPNGQNYKELSPTLNNHKSLQANQCSFWSQYVPVLNSSTDFSSLVTQTKPKPEKDAYS